MPGPAQLARPIHNSHTILCDYCIAVVRLHLLMQIHLPLPAHSREMPAIGVPNASLQETEMGPLRKVTLEKSETGPSDQQGQRGMNVTVSRAYVCYRSHQKAPRRGEAGQSGQIDCHALRELPAFCKHASIKVELPRSLVYCGRKENR